MTSGMPLAIVVVAVLLVPLPGCARRDSSPPPPAAAAAPAAGDANLTEAARKVVAWLPGDSAVDTWKRARAPQAFDPDNLWESIDGGADTYVAFGFQELVTEPCTEQASGAELNVEVYRMADEVGAFGIYAQERNPSANFVTLGAEGYAAPNVVNFWNGPYYVKLTALKAGKQAAEAMLKLARGISTHIGPPSPVPAGARALPPRGQVPHTVKYIPRGVLGQSYLANGFEAQYQIGGKTCRLVSASFESPSDAADAFTRYRKFVASSGRVGRKLTKPGEEGFAGSESFNGSIVAARAANTIVVGLGAPSEKAALDLIDAFLKGNQ